MSNTRFVRSKPAVLHPRERELPVADIVEPVSHEIAPPPLEPLEEPPPDSDMARITRMIESLKVETRGLARYNEHLQRSQRESVEPKARPSNLVPAAVAAQEAAAATLIIRKEKKETWRGAVCAETLTSVTLDRLTRQKPSLKLKQQQARRASLARRPYSSLQVRRSRPGVTFGKKTSSTNSKMQVAAMSKGNLRQPRAAWTPTDFDTERRSRHAGTTGNAFSKQVGQTASRSRAIPKTGPTPSKKMRAGAACSCELCNGLGFPDCYTTVHNSFVPCPACHYGKKHV